MKCYNCIRFARFGSHAPLGVRVVLVLLALAALLAPVLARADIQITARSVGNGQMVATGLDLHLSAGMPAALALQVGQLDIPSMSWRGAVSWQCSLQHTRTDDGSSRWQCSGPLDVDGQVLQLLAEVQGDRLKLDVHHDGASGRLELPVPATWPLQARVEQVPLQWLSGTVRELWPAGQLAAGMLDAGLTTPDGKTWHGDYTVAAIGVDSDDGLFAVADVSVSGTFEAVPERMHMKTQASLRGGEILAAPVYVRLPDSPVQVAVDARAIDGAWRIDSLRWHDGDVLELDASARIQPAAQPWLRELQMAVAHVDLGPASRRYASSWLDTLGFEGLVLTGALSGRAGLDASGLDHVAVDITDPVGIDDSSGRFALVGLRGGVDWHARQVRPARELSWQSAHIHRVPIDGARLTLRSADGRLASAVPVRIGLLGGQLVLNNLSFGADDGRQLSTGIALADIDLAQLAQALDWPPLAGRLGGAIANINVDGQVIDLQGGLMLDTFDGTVNVTALRLERPFGVAPSLHADIDFQGLDLAQLTGAFDFGQVTGLLDGYMHGLRLLDWQPVAFDARLQTRSGGRISQHAVNNLSSIGGSPMTAGLQGTVLKFFETFGYAGIGIGCRLVDNVCTMDGLEPSNGGYTIVKGSGLPRVSVIGFQRQVDWPTLVDRLKLATSGQTPIIQ